MSFYNTLVKETETARNVLYTVPQLTDGMNGDIKPGQPPLLSPVFSS